jgi:hypothetical protein
MWRKTLTISIYSLGAVAASFFWITRAQDSVASEAMRNWLLLFSAPLLFAFAYPLYLFSTATPEPSHQRSIAILQGLGAVITTVLFVVLGSAFWRNPLRNVDSMLLWAIPLIVEPVFLLAALSVLIKKKRVWLVKLACLLLWPYWLWLALTFCGRFFEASLPRAALAFLCFIVPLLFAFAAGAVFSRPTIAHCSALAGLVSAPWVYWTALRDTPLGNIWTDFNVPDRDLQMNNILAIAKLTIIAVGLMALAVTTAAIRVLPTKWKLRGRLLCERSWPAFAVALIFIALWFSQSVMPYRISGAVDYGGWPIFQILHVEKRGLQFHETCISVWGYRNHPESVSFSENGRRLFQYRFQQKQTWGKLPDSLKDRISSIIQSSQVPNRNWELVRPVRAWNAEGWYFTGEGIDLRVYRTDRGANPPKEITDLFHDLYELPRLRESDAGRKDICLGFCYDPLSALGLLYANHRCRYDATVNRYVCR